MSRIAQRFRLPLVSRIHEVAICGSIKGQRNQGARTGLGVQGTQPTRERPEYRLIKIDRKRLREKPLPFEITNRNSRQNL
jgi:hypothetical protein